jgi:hypothetical protein
MTIIYETINLHNKEHGIYPWRYIGSDQFNNPLYLGSSRDLKKDIEILGRSAFMKIVLEECGDIENKELRKIEVEKYLKPNKVRSDQSYYNRSETYSPGCGQKGMKHSKKFARTEKWKLSRTGHSVSEDSRKLMAEKKRGNKASLSTKKKMSQTRDSYDNPCALEWTIINPYKEVINIRSLRKWCRENNYNFYDIYYSRNGWKSTRHGTGVKSNQRKLNAN